MINVVELEELRLQLELFEKQYQMKSEDFYSRFHKGELGDDADFFEWSATYSMYQDLLAKGLNHAG